MSSPVDSYVHGIRQKFKLFANWLPNSPRALGDVGVLIGNQFDHTTSLGNLGVPFGLRIGLAGTDLTHTSGSSVSMEIKLAGEPLPGTSLPIEKAGAAVSFADAGAFLFHAVAPTQSEIDDRNKISRILARMLKSGRWKREWCLVSEVVAVDHLTVLVSRTRGSKITLQAEAGLGPMVAPLATGSGGLSVTSQSGEVTSILAANGAVPLFALVRLKQSIVERLLGEELDLRRLDGFGTTPEDYFEAVEP
jgi:hypothetical protein